MTIAQLIRLNHIVGLSLACLLFAGCATTPQSAATAPAVLTSQQVASALQLWPTSTQRTFFTTIQAAGNRTTATGLLNYHGPRDFRLTAITETGNVLFDVTYNWAGITVHRTANGLDKSVVNTIAQDFSQVFCFPESLEGLQPAPRQATLRITSALHDVFTYTFLPPDGRLAQTSVRYSLFDTLTIDIPRYDARGWPQEIALSRPARLYTIQVTFTDTPGTHLAEKTVIHTNEKQQ